MAERISREVFTKFLVGLGVAGALGLNLKEELDRDTRGIETNDGKWLGLYEMHDVGYVSQDVPEDTDIFYREFASPTWHTYNIWEFKNVVSYYNPKLGLLNEEIWQQYDAGKIELVMADVAVPSLHILETIDANTWASILGASGVTFSLAKRVAEKDLKLTRREFLFAGLFSWGALPTISSVALNKFNTRQKTPENRLSDRFDALLSTTQPKELITNFRSALTALKLIKLAQLKQQSLGRKPLTVMNTGSRHAVIEEFLQIGEAGCRQLVEVYLRILKTIDAEWLRQMIELNGGPEMMASLRVFNANFEISAAEVEALFEEGMGPSELNHKVFKYQTQKHETRYTDEQLLSLFQELLD